MDNFHIAAILSPIFIAFVFLMQLVFDNRFRTELPIRILFTFLTSVLILSVTIVLYQTGFYQLSAHFFGLYCSTLVIVFPLFFLYVKAIIWNKVSVKEYIIHLSPALFVFTMYYLLYLFVETDIIAHWMKDYFKTGISDGSIAESLLNRLFIATQFIHIFQAVTYFVLILKHLLSNQQKIENTFIQPEKYRLNWILGYCFIYGIVTLIGISINFLPIQIAQKNFFYTDISSIGLSVFALYVGINGFKQISVGKEIEELDNKSDTLYNSDIQQNLSNEAIVEKINQFLITQKAFLNMDLKIWDIVYATGINRTYISKTINSTYNLSFCNYINKMRIQEACTLIEQNPEMSIEAIAFDCGFNSLSTFYRAFKQIMKISPAEYKKKY